MKPQANDIVYLPPSLAKAVRAMTEKPFTFITAGSGFGKTTAVASCLARAPKDAALQWYTCFGEPPERAWEGVCRLISFADARVGDYLSKLALPTLNHLGYISSLMAEIRCERETILVIDNFQLAHFPAPRRLVDALACHRCDKLHLAVLSQPLRADEEPAGANPRVYHIPQTAFCFCAEDAAALFALGGAALTHEEALRLCGETEGWVAALRLHLSALLADGRLCWSLSVNELMERSFWRPLDAQRRELFLGLSLLDNFTEAQAARMLNRDALADELWATVRGSAFVREAGDGYALHALLRGFLAGKRKARPRAFAQAMNHRAGAAVKASLNDKTGLTRTALGCLERLAAAGTDESRRSALAALEMAASFRAYNDIAQMSRHHAAAKALLADPRDFYVTNDSWTFLIPSVAYMFWRESGALLPSAALLRKGVPRYALLGGGKGLGGPEMMEAEALHHLLPQLYYLLEIAVFHEGRGEREPACRAVERALKLALPDGVLLPFAESYAQLQGVLAQARFPAGREEAAQRIRALGRRFANGAAAVRAALDGASPPYPAGARNCADGAKTRAHQRNCRGAVHFPRHGQKHAEQSLFQAVHPRQARASGPAALTK